MTSSDEETPGSISIQGGISVGPAARVRARAVEGFEVADEGGIAATDLWGAMRRVAGAVTVVTARGGEGFVGITVSAFCMVSLEPPLVLACINTESQTLDVIGSSGAFAVTVLSGRQEFISEVFAGRAPRPDAEFSTVSHRTMVTGAPILLGGLAWFDCRVEATHPGGDHAIIVGRVVAAGVAEGADDPILYFGSQYRHLST